MKRKIISIIVLVLTIFTSSIVYSEIDIKGESAILIDYNSGEIIYSKNKDKELFPASITKVMTLLLAGEALNNEAIMLSDEVLISEYASSMGGTQVYLDSGEYQTVESLIKATSIRSANDAAVALGEHIAGSTDGFVKLMNDKAAKLNMKNTNFANPTGLPDKNHYTTAYDISIMSRELLRYPEIKKYLSIYMEDMDVGKKKRSTQTMVNTNKLIKEYNGITGIKTGFTNEAKHCISASAERDGLHLIAIIMGAESSETRFDESKKLLDHGFTNYQSINIGKKGDAISIIPIEKGNSNNLEIVMKEDSSILRSKDDKFNIEKDIELPKYVEAPVKENEVLGKINILVDEEIIDSVDIVAKTNIKRSSFLGLLSKSLENLLLNK